MEIKTRSIHHYKVFCPVGRLQDQDTEEFQKQVQREIRDGLDKLVIDLTEATTISSHFLGALVRIWKLAVEVGGSIYMLSNREAINDVFQSTNLNALIRVFGDETEFRAKVLGRPGLSYSAVTREKGKYTIVDLSEPMDVVADAQHISDLLSGLFGDKPRFVAINMANVLHIYSDVIGVLIKWKKKADESGGKLVLFNLTEEVFLALQLSGMMGVLSVLESEDQLT